MEIFQNSYFCPKNQANLPVKTKDAFSVHWYIGESIVRGWSPLDEYLESNAPECILCDEETADLRLEGKAALYRVLSEDGAEGTLFKYSAADEIIAALAKELPEGESGKPVLPGGRITGFFGLFDDGESAIRAFESAE